MARLLAAEDAALAPERLEHVAVADVGRDDADPALLHQPVEAEVRHHRDRDEVDAEVEREDGEDLVAVDDVAAPSTASIRSPSPSNATPRSSAALAHGLLQQREVGRAAADVDVRAVGLVADRGHLGAEPLERLRRDPGVGAVGAVDGDPQAGEVGAEALDDVLEVAVGGDLDAVDRAAAAGSGASSSASISSSDGVGQLAARRRRRT